MPQAKFRDRLRKDRGVGGLNIVTNRTARHSSNALRKVSGLNLSRHISHPKPLRDFPQPLQANNLTVHQIGRKFFPIHRSSIIPTPTLHSLRF